MRPVQDSSSSPVPVPAVPQNETRRQFPLPFRTSTLSRSHPDRPDTSYNISSSQHRQSVSQSVNRSVGRAVSCPFRVVTLRPWNPPGQDSPPIHPTSLSFPLPHLAVDLVLNHPSFLPSQLAAQPARFLLLPTGTWPSSFCLPDLPDLPAPSPSLEPGNPVHLSSSHQHPPRIGSGILTLTLIGPDLTS